MRHVAVDRTGDRQAALAQALLLLDAGEAVVLFPEGTISPSFVPAAPRQGAARLALASGAPLVPFATWGGQRARHPEHPSLRGDRVLLVVAFGTPVPVAPDDDATAVTARLWSRSPRPRRRGAAHLPRAAAR